MSKQPPMICRPTRWFFLRATAMLSMFAIFSAWFYYDAQVGYRKKNERYFIERAFHQAVADFTAKQGGKWSTDAWREYAMNQVVAFPDDRSILPVDMALPMAWPEVLWDAEKVKPLNVAALWREHTASRGWEIAVPEEYYSARKIREQWVVCWICLGLTVVAAFFLARTMRRTITVDGESITDASGKRVAFADFTLLDLRKWDTKGIAIMEYRDANGTGRMRLDGLTYGGFQADHGQPAERMMDLIRENFSGELLEYTATGSMQEVHGDQLADGTHKQPPEQLMGECTPPKPSGRMDDGKGGSDAAARNE